MQEVYLAAAKRLEFFAQNEDVPIYFKLRTILLQTLADIERKNLQAASRTRRHGNGLSRGTDFTRS